MLLVIFGAGASYDHDRTNMNNAVQMPLTNTLISSRLTFAKQAKEKWLGAVSLLNRLNDLKTENTNFNLEESLYSELRRNIPSVNAQLASFKYYIHEIIQNCQKQVLDYNQGNTNYTRLLNVLQEKEIDQRQGVALVTFNYDTLLDIACTQLYPDWTFNKFEDYITGSSMVRLYKPHGSLNWRKIYNAGSHQSDRINTIKALMHLADYNLIPGAEQITDYRAEYLNEVGGGYNIFEPILALPYKEKTDFVFPENHKQLLIEDMKKITHILTVGWRGTEQHFYDKILSNIPTSNKVKVLHVNHGGTEIEANFNKIINEKDMQLHYIFREGFSEFLKKDLLLTQFLVS